MSIAVERLPIAGDDSQYREGIDHLQKGEWEAAIRCLEEAARVQPDAPAIRRALEAARFQAQRDAGTRVKARRWAFPWWPAAVRGIVLVLVAVAALQGARFVNRAVSPMLAQAQAGRQHAALLKDARAYLASGDLDTAQQRFEQLLAALPGNKEAIAGLAEVASQRELLTLYQQAGASEDQGEYQAALATYTEISLRSPGYRDVSARITAIGHRQEIEKIFAEAEAAYQAQQYADAAAKYQQVYDLDTRYRPDYIAGQLFGLYMTLGREIIDRRPPDLAAIPQASTYFAQALSIQPRSQDATGEKRNADLYLQGRDAHAAARWDEAIRLLRPVYDQAPGYLGGTVAALLYDAYIHNGEGLEKAGDLYSAYEQYRQASQLPIEDTTLATGRMAALVPYLTPTPTPTLTPTPAPPATPTPIPPPTAVPTPRPLISFRGQIAFFSDQEDQPGLWVMDPDGKNRVYLATTSALKKEYDNMLKQAQFSPDGRYQAFVKDTRPAAQIFIQLPPHEVYGPLPPRQLTTLEGLSYDPVWSPDGSRIAFVSQQKGSDDVWVVYADGNEPKNLTPNVWEWDKHPSWSPDSSRIVFWSNRSGGKQIYVMDAEGRNIVNISNTEWDEYDPLWIK